MISEEDLAKPIWHISQYLFIAQMFPSLGWVYRGQANADWPLIPKAGRPEFYLPNDRDLGRFNDWTRQAAPWRDELPASFFERLAMAQHYGLATRMLDWSTNPLVALFFAVESQPDRDGAVAFYLPDGFLSETAEGANSVDKVCRYDPPPFDERIRAQSGIFTYHPHPNEPIATGDAPNGSISISLFGKNFAQLSVPSGHKEILLKQLSDINVSRKTLFPRFDGLSHFVNWHTSRMVSAHHEFRKDGVKEDDEIESNMNLSSILQKRSGAGGKVD